MKNCKLGRIGGFSIVNPSLIDYYCFFEGLPQFIVSIFVLFTFSIYNWKTWWLSG